MDYFPTTWHKNATEDIVEFFDSFPYISSVLLTCSCARGKATPESCGEFLQALFIYNKKYPICYEKWIKEQIVDILGIPELYTGTVKTLKRTVFNRST